MAKQKNKFAEYKTMEPMGFIKDFRDFILDGVKTSPEWAESIALGVLATMCGKFRIYDSIGPLKLNIWTMTIGPSGLAKKSTPLNYYAFQMMRGLEEITGRSMLMPKSFTVEGITEYLSVQDEDGNYINNQGILIRDEFSQVFKGIKKDYQGDLLEFLSELFDGTTQKRFTRKTKLEEVRDVYMSLLGATTETLYTCMDKNFFVQGTGNRFLYIMQEPDKDIEPLDVDKFFRRENKYIKEERFDDFAMKLAAIPESSITDLQPAPSAARLWGEYENAVMSHCLYTYNDDRRSTDHTYLNRMPVAVLKIAGLSAISRSYETIFRTRDTSNIDFLMITEDDMKYAIGKVERHIDHFNRMMTNWRIDPAVRKVEVNTSELDYILDCFDNCKDGFMTQNEILKKSGMTKNTHFHELLGTLVSRNELTIIPAERIKELNKEIKAKHGISSTGKPPMGYCRTSFERTQVVQELLAGVVQTF